MLQAVQAHAGLLATCAVSLGASACCRQCSGTAGAAQGGPGLAHRPVQQLASPDEYDTPDLSYALEEGNLPPATRAKLCIQSYASMPMPVSSFLLLDVTFSYYMPERNTKGQL